ncbi:hypothetical protein N7G274_004817 [Stereocaulon virgatum]|uniref:Uncharacterized protein n=1 Tax=Stereocaulon virgatum TaxID=373712 RepID=A0ABR4A9F1_9LECA
MSHHQNTKAPTETTQPHVDTSASHTRSHTPDSNTSPTQAPNPQARSTSANEWTVIRPIDPLTHNYALNSTLFGSAAQYAVRQAMLRNDFHQALVREGLEKSDAERDAPAADAFPYREVSKKRVKGKENAKSSNDASASDSHGYVAQDEFNKDILDGSGGGWQPARRRSRKGYQ